MRRFIFVAPLAILALGLANSWSRAGERTGVVSHFTGQIQRCYLLPTGGVGEAPAEVEVRLFPDGSLSEPPKVLRGSPLAARAAVLAIERCAPFKIPAELDLGYEGWKVLRITFETE